MIIGRKALEYFSPWRMSKRMLDGFMAKAWFRTANMLFRSQVTCFDNDICSPINIRIRLYTHQFSKKQQKLMRRNGKLFRYEIRKVKSLKQYEDIFAAHQHRFKSFLSNSLQDFLVLSSHFDTHEIRVFDEDLLVAVSFFDVGNVSLTSLLGLFEPRYASYSLGFYTMLLELDYAKKNGYKWYYPGYVHGGPSMYDYKLRLGKVQVFDWETESWLSNIDPHFMPNMADDIKKNTHLIIRILNDLNLKYERKLNLFFGWYYYQIAYQELYKYPLMLMLDDNTVLAYDAEKYRFIHSVIELHIPFRDINLILATDFDRKKYHMDVMKEKTELFSHHNIEIFKKYLTDYYL